MKIKLTLAAIALTMAPSLGMAMCSGDDHAKATMSCADGKVLDSATNSCVPVSG